MIAKRCQKKERPGSCALTGSYRYIYMISIYAEHVYNVFDVWFTSFSTVCIYYVTDTLYVRFLFIMYLYAYSTLLMLFIFYVVYVCTQTCLQVSYSSGICLGSTDLSKKKRVVLMLGQAAKSELVDDLQFKRHALRDLGLSHRDKEGHESKVLSSDTWQNHRCQ